MKISGDTKNITPDLVKFLEDIDFHVDGSTLSIKKAGFREGVMETELCDGRIGRNWNLTYFGISSWPYTDGSGTKIVPSQDSPGFAHLELVKMFESSTGRRLTDEESTILRDSVIKSAADSVDVRAWAENLDLEALHAFDHVYVEHLDDAYEWIAGDEVASQAMKKFVRDFPILTLAVFYGGGTYEAAAAGKTPEEAYKFAVHHVMSNGLPCDSGGLDGRIWSIGPMSMEFLESIRGFKVDVASVSMDESVILVAEAIDLARRLPIGSMPVDKVGFESLRDCGAILRELQSDDGGVESCIEDGRAFGLKFTDDEVAKMFASAAAAKFTNFPKGLEDDSRALQPLGCYGVVLAGHEDWIRNHIQDGFNNVDGAPPSMMDFSALKSALVSEGFVAVYEKAAAFFKEAEASADLDQAPTP